MENAFQIVHNSPQLPLHEHMHHGERERKTGMRKGMTEAAKGERDRGGKVHSYVYEMKIVRWAL